MKVSKFIILSLFMLTLTACGRTEISLNEYLTTQISGAEGKGMIDWSLDTNALVQNHRAAFGLKENESQAEVIAEVDKLTGTFNQSDSLFNGDSVTFAWDSAGIRALEQEYKVKLIADNLTVSVNGLPEVQQLNPFDYVTIEYQQNEDEVMPVVKPTGGIPFWLDFIVTEQTGLHPGDHFTVKIGKTISGNELTQEQIAEFAQNQGYEITLFENEYLVPESIP